MWWKSMAIAYWLWLHVAVLHFEGKIFRIANFAFAVKSCSRMARLRKLCVCKNAVKIISLRQKCLYIVTLTFFAKVVVGCQGHPCLCKHALRDPFLRESVLKLEILDFSWKAYCSRTCSHNVFAVQILHFENCSRMLRSPMLCICKHALKIHF